MCTGSVISSSAQYGILEGSRVAQLVTTLLKFYDTRRFISVFIYHEPIPSIYIYIYIYIYI